VNESQQPVADVTRRVLGKRLYLVEVHNIFTERDDIKLGMLTDDEAKQIVDHFGGEDCGEVGVPDDDTCAYANPIEPLEFMDLCKELGI
jgi:hypothetical protein